MSLSIHQIKRWYKMLTGRSVWHVNQDLGKCFRKDSLRGYYNNMTEKVSMMPDLLDGDGLPKLNLAGGQDVDFPVAIFQYGLGAYDLFLQTGDVRYERKFMQCAHWAIDNQDTEGRWNNFFYIFPDNPYGAMAQGEAASLLTRAYKHSGDDRYLDSAKRAVDFMLKSVNDGGVTKYEGEDVILMEYTHLPVVMNGWIFAWWGLYDLVLTISDRDPYCDAMRKSLDSLVRALPRFKNAIWSNYDDKGKIASPFYHNLHIAQMQAMYELTGIRVFDEYAKVWRKQQNNPLCKAVAFLVKAFQKIAER